MKSQLILLGALFCITLPAFAVTNGSEGLGGGDEDGLAFQQALTNAVNNLRGSKLELPREVNADIILAQLQTAKVVFVETPLLATTEGASQESIALNDPATGLIQVNRPRWKMLIDIHMREAIALHEVLSLLGQEQTGAYPISSRYAALFGFSKDFSVEWSALLQGPAGITRLESRTCSMYTEIQDFPSGQVVPYQNDDVGLLLSWLANGVNYSMTVNLASQDPKMPRLVLRQNRSVWHTDASLGGDITESNSKAIFQNPDGNLVEKDFVSTFFTRDIAPDQTWGFDFKDGKIGDQTDKSTTIKNPDGSQVILTEKIPFESARNGGYSAKVLKSTSSCTQKPLSYSWVHAWGDPAVAARVEIFAASILQTSKAEAAYKDCATTAGDAACDLAKQNLTRASVATDDLWLKLVQLAPAQESAPVTSPSRKNKPSPPKKKPQLTKRSKGIDLDELRRNPYRIPPANIEMNQHMLDSLAADRKKNEDDTLQREIDDLHRSSIGQRSHFGHGGFGRH